MPKFENWSKVSEEELESEGFEFFRDAFKAGWIHDKRDLVLYVNDLPEDEYAVTIVNEEENHRFDHVKTSEAKYNDGVYSSLDDAMEGARDYMRKHPEPIIEGIIDEIEYPDRDEERVERIVWSFGGGSFSTGIVFSDDSGEHYADLMSGAGLDALKPLSMSEKKRFVRTYLKVESIVDQEVYGRGVAMGLTAGSSPEDFADSVEEAEKEIEAELRDRISDGNKDIVKLSEGFLE